MSNRPGACRWNFVHVVSLIDRLCGRIRRNSVFGVWVIDWQIEFNGVDWLGFWLAFNDLHGKWPLIYCFYWYNSIRLDPLLTILPTPSLILFVSLFKLSFHVSTKKERKKEKIERKKERQTGKKWNKKIHFWQISKGHTKKGIEKRLQDEGTQNQIGFFQLYFFTLLLVLQKFMDEVLIILASRSQSLGL